MNKLSIFILSLLFVAASCSKPQQKQDTNTRIKVAVFEGNGASATCVTETFEALRIDTGIEPSIIHASEILTDKLNEIDVIIFPGGSGSKELTNLGEQAAKRIVDFVTKDGKGAVGICAGGFLFSTTKDYPSLQLVSATEWDREHYNKGRGLVEFAVTEAGSEIFPELNGKGFLQYYDGPVFMPSDSGKSGTKVYKELAVYTTDIAIKPNFPKGVTPGKTILLTENRGEGRVFVCAGHPEATPGMRWMVPRMARWAANSNLVAYAEKWVKPELNDSAILFTSDLAKQEKAHFWKLLGNKPTEKIAAMQALHSLRSRPAVRWNLGMLRDSDPLVRAQAARILAETEYTAAIRDLQTAYNTEVNTETKAQISASIKVLSEFK